MPSISSASQQVSARMLALAYARHHDRSPPQSNDCMAWLVRHVAHRLCTDRESGPDVSRSEYAVRIDLLGRGSAGCWRSRARSPSRCLRVLQPARASHACTAVRLAATAGDSALRRRTTFSFTDVRLAGHIPGSTPPGFAAPRLNRSFAAMRRGPAESRGTLAAASLQLGHFAPCVRDAAGTLACTHET